MGVLRGMFISYNIHDKKSLFLKKFFKKKKIQNFFSVNFIFDNKMEELVGSPNFLKKLNSSNANNSPIYFRSPSNGRLKKVNIKSKMSASNATTSMENLNKLVLHNKNNKNKSGNVENENKMNNLTPPTSPLRPRNNMNSPNPSSPFVKIKKKK